MKLLYPIIAISLLFGNIAHATSLTSDQVVALNAEGETLANLQAAYRVESRPQLLQETKDLQAMIAEDQRELPAERADAIATIAIGTGVATALGLLPAAPAVGMTLERHTEYHFKKQDLAELQARLIIVQNLLQQK